MVAASKHLMLRIACFVLLASFLGGCATGRDPRDPLEPFNRGVYQFNETLDKAILKPTAQAYRFVIPQFIRASVSNFFSNLNDVVIALNNLLQGKFTAAYSDLGRVAINSTLGLLGLFDVASEAGIEKHDEDFGQTLGYWGVGDGPFVMLPFFGPSTGRDVVGRAADHYVDPVTYVDPSRARNQLWGTRIVNRRAELLDASTVLQTAALDPYEFIRDAYLQRRRNLIHDGSPPPDREFMDPQPAPKSTMSPPAAFPASAERTGSGSVLVSGDGRTPVLTAFQPSPETVAMPVRQPKPAPAAASVKAEPTVFAKLWRSFAP
jgi:phospholipid-binding lipoprotein MlaA